MIYTQHHDAPVALPNSIAILATQVKRTTRSGEILGPEELWDLEVLETIKEGETVFRK